MSVFHRFHIFFKICSLSLSTSAPHGDNSQFPASQLCYAEMYLLTSPVPQLQMLKEVDSNGQADVLLLDTLP